MSVSADSNLVIFNEWLEKNDAQIANLLLEYERNRSEKAEKFMSDKLEHINNKLNAKDEEIKIERAKAYEKVDEVVRERDEALESANKLRNNLS